MNIGRTRLYFRSLIDFIRGRSIIPHRANIGKNVFIGKNVKMDWIANGAHIYIGDEATIVSGVRILCHDASSNRRINGTRVQGVKIGRRAYIGANSIILPGVDIGDDAVIGAGSVVASNVPSGSVAAGVPARVIGSTIELDNRRIEEMKSTRVFDAHRYGRRSVSDAEIDEMSQALRENAAYYLKESRDENRIS